MSRWSRGFGIVGILLGEKHFLNIRNPVYGIFFYITLILLKLTKKRRWTRKLICYMPSFIRCVLFAFLYMW
ncbi:Vitamin K epoxide reductase complex subunit 1-like protein [Trichinella spiralis]|uniref:Vitamin K epoxide reductase complex subunit 1-like protein n=1 Tax=Trichinella spiralis TaxID=6334 RepID=A0ABR3KMR0_TRISP